MLSIFETLYTSITIKLNSFQHLKEKKCTYIEHFKKVLTISYILTKANICILIHAIYPPLFETTTSNIILKLNQDLQSDIHTNNQN
jgi:hypothetical protein